VKLSLERNAAANSEAVPYFVRVEFQSLTLDLSEALHIPVFPRPIREKTFYVAEACGYQARTDNLDQIPYLVGRLLQGMIAAHRLPSYVFIARYSRNVHLVHTIDDEVVVKIPHGPSFRHVELAKIREYLSDYLRISGLLGTPNKPDKLHVRGIHRKSLALVRPIFYFKKRSTLDDNDFWAPVFLSDHGQSIYTFAASAKREAPLEAGEEVLTLHNIVTKALIADKRLKNPYDLRPDRLFTEQWEQLKKTLTLSEQSICLDNIEFPVYSNGKVFIALENRSDERRYSLFLGEDLEDIRHRIRQSFTRRGLVE